MLLLAIETATDHSSVVLLQDGEELATWRESTHQDLVRRLAEEVGAVMRRGGRGFSDLNLVTVGLGPGSFTSLRVGLATAKGLCLAWDLPLVGVSSLAAMVWQTRGALAGVICPVLDARRGEMYGGLYRVTGEGVVRLGDDFVTTAADLAGHLGPAEGEPVTVFGQLDLLPAAEIETALAGRGRVWSDQVVLPDAAAVGYLGARRFAETGADDLGFLHPIYVRKSYAEEKFDLDLGLR
jgi:tRNA threonylcarbamoyladenosine biosynthesis protein TsaB